MKTLILILVLACGVAVMARPFERRSPPRQHVYVFTASWCGPCKEMHKKVWPDRRVQLALAPYHKHVMDIDDRRFREYVARYKIRDIPCVVIVDEHGDEMDRRVGYMSVPQLILFLKGSRR